MKDYFKDESLKSVANGFREAMSDSLEAERRGEVITPPEWESLINKPDQEIVDYVDGLVEKDREIVVDVMGKYSDPHGFNLSLFRDTGETISAFFEYIIKAVTEEEIVFARMLLQGICQWYYELAKAEKTQVTKDDIQSRLT